MSRVIAVLCSDIHLCHQCPTARSAEPDWYAAMQRPLDELRAVAEYHVAPIICAGDVFDHWNSPPELINFAIRHLPNMYAVPGQHDLPNHRLDELRRSAYWTLVEAGVIEQIGRAGTYLGSDLFVPLSIYPFPWGSELLPITRMRADQAVVHLAVVHRYLWINKHTKYPDAPADRRLSSIADSLQGYDAAVFGDNHIGFQASAGGCQVANCGCMIPRKQDERGNRPRVYLLHDDGSLKPHYLDTSKDLWIDPDTSDGADVDLPGMGQFIDDLRGLQADSLDFRDAVRRYIADAGVGPRVAEILLEAIE